jgi:hypothetical protein
MYGWIGHMACIAEARNTFRIFGCNALERNHLCNMGIDGVITLRWFRK